MTRIAIVILNYNGKKYLEKFLPTLIKHNQLDAALYVADNASTDGSISFLKDNFPEIHIIDNGENAGFSKGYNDALNKIEAEYYVLLNSDVEVSDNWIKPVIELMDSDSSIGACQPKIRSYLNKSAFEYAGAAGGFIDKYGYPFCRGRIFFQIEEDQGQYDEITEIFWATGACMFVRASLYKQLGGLDNDFEFHMEEIDFCWRLKNAGYKIMYCPDSIVYHIGGGTLPKNNSRKTYYNFRNNLSLLYKNLPKNRIIKVFIARFFLDFAASLKFLFEGGFKNFFAVVKGYLHFYQSIAKHREKRKIIMPKPTNMIFYSSLVFKHYIGRVRKFSQLNRNKFK